MFIGAEVWLDIGFSAAQARLANLASGGLLRHASDDAYRDLGAGLARVGPLGAAPGMSRLVTVRFGDLAVHADFAVAAMRWEAAGPGGALFPALDADVKLARTGQDVTVLAVSGTYRPPLGSLGAGAVAVALDKARGRPRDHAPDRPGNYPGLHAARRDRHRQPSSLTRGRPYQAIAGTSCLARA